MSETREKILKIVTYHSDDGTSGYKLSFEEVDEIISLFKSMVEAKRKKVPRFDFGPDGPPNGAAEHWQEMEIEFGGYNEALDDLLKALGEEKHE